jgi:hypothetical protein
MTWPYQKNIILRAKDVFRNMEKGEKEKRGIIAESSVKRRIKSFSKKNIRGLRKFECY